MTSPAASALPAHLGWRLLALLYDLFPVFALSLLFGAVVTGVAALLGHADVSKEPWAPWLMTLGLWGFTGAYFIASWSRGGATLGMRPWRLRVLGADGRPALKAALLRRYAAATLPALLVLELAALLPWAAPRTPLWIAAGVAIFGMAWSLVDRDGAALYDRLAGTRFVRLLSGA